MGSKEYWPFKLLFSHRIYRLFPLFNARGSGYCFGKICWRQSHKVFVFFLKSRNIRECISPALGGRLEGGLTSLGVLDASLRPGGAGVSPGLAVPVLLYWLWSGVLRQFRIYMFARGSLQRNKVCCAKEH